jgi:hypothetical protein
MGSKKLHYKKILLSKSVCIDLLHLNLCPLSLVKASHSSPMSTVHVPDGWEAQILNKTAL